MSECVKINFLDVKNELDNVPLDAEKFRLIDANEYKETCERLTYKELDCWVKKGLMDDEVREIGKLSEKEGQSEVLAERRSPLSAYNKNRQVDENVRVRISGGQWQIPLYSMLSADGGDKKQD